jgi:hypothetical protein
MKRVDTSAMIVYSQKHGKLSASTVGIASMYIVSDLMLCVVNIGCIKFETERHHVSDAMGTRGHKRQRGTKGLLLGSKKWRDIWGKNLLP